MVFSEDLSFNTKNYRGTFANFGLLATHTFTNSTLKAAGGGLHGGDGAHVAPERLPRPRPPRRHRTWRGRWRTPLGTLGRLLAVVAKVLFHKWNHDHSSKN